MDTLTKKGHALQSECMTSINKLFHIASMSEHSELADMLDDMEYIDFQKLIPSLSEKTYQSYEGDFGCLLHDHDKFGFIAECYFNIPQKFSFAEDGRFRSCSNSCSSYIFYTYAENMEELLDRIREKDKEMFKIETDKARKEQGINF